MAPATLVAWADELQKISAERSFASSVADPAAWFPQEQGANLYGAGMVRPPKVRKLPALAGAQLKGTSQSGAIGAPATR